MLTHCTVVQHQQQQQQQHNSCPQKQQQPQRNIYGKRPRGADTTDEDATRQALVELPSNSTIVTATTTHSSTTTTTAACSHGVSLVAGSRMKSSSSVLSTPLLTTFATCTTTTTTTASSTTTLVTPTAVTITSTKSMSYESLSPLPSLSFSAMAITTTCNTMRPAKRQRALLEVEKHSYLLAKVGEIMRQVSLIDPVYIKDLYQTNKENEDLLWQSRPREGMYRVQKDINAQMRGILVSWLCEVTEEYSLQPKTLFLAVNYMDRVLECMPVTRSTLQLVGVCCLLIAAKYEEVCAPLVDDFVDVTDNCYSPTDVLKMEQLILGILNFKLTVSTTYDFVWWFLIVSNEGQIMQQKLRPYALDLCTHLLSIYEFNIKYPSSLVAASVVCLARHAFNLPAWVPLYESLTGYKSYDIKDCVREIFEQIYHRENSPLEKYHNSKEGCFAQVQMLCSSNPSYTYSCPTL